MASVSFSAERSGVEESSIQMVESSKGTKSMDPFDCAQDRLCNYVQGEEGSSDVIKRYASPGSHQDGPPRRTSPPREDELTSKLLVMANQATDKRGWHYSGLTIQSPK